MTRPTLWTSTLGLALVLSACEAGDKAAEPARETSSAPSTAPAKDDDAKPSDGVPDKAHRVVFADRSSMGYLLLVDAVQEPEAPTREQLKTMVKKAFAANLDDEEVQLLLYLIDQQPKGTEDSLELDKDDVRNAQLRRLAARDDLIALHIDVKSVSDVIPAKAFDDPVLMRDLPRSELPTLPRRKWAILLRADYRCQKGFRGLRLLQALVRVVATETGAIVHDPDLLETMDVPAFTRRRLQSGMGNVADQVAVVPFPDPRHGKGFFRLSTRGMRRFGSVDLELDGLPGKPARLQQGTDLLAGLASVMARESEVSETGIAIELDEVVPIFASDVDKAYAGHSRRPSRCEDCPGQVLVHVVERDHEDQDPVDHLTARVVAPRTTSDKGDYEHPTWALKALDSLFGPVP